MTSRFFRAINRFFEGAGEVVSTPSGYAHHSPATYKAPRTFNDLLGSDAFFDTRH